MLHSVYSTQCTYHTQSGTRYHALLHYIDEQYITMGYTSRERHEGWWGGGGGNL